VGASSQVPALSGRAASAQLGVRGAPLPRGDAAAAGGSAAPPARAGSGLRRGMRRPDSASSAGEASQGRARPPQAARGAGCGGDARGGSRRASLSADRDSGRPMPAHQLSGAIRPSLRPARVGSASGRPWWQSGRWGMRRAASGASSRAAHAARGGPGGRRRQYAHGMLVRLSGARRRLAISGGKAAVGGCGRL
jgi:hypothetical protein